MKDLVGTTIGQHEIVEQLGGGGMANVYKAFHSGLDVYRAVKVIRPELADTQGFQERFQREARAVAALRHPHIVQIHDFGQADGLFYMIMEFVEGEDLKSRMLREGAIRPFSEVVRLIEQIAGALGYAHSRGVVHRDVKPDNVLLDKDGQAILADFGIAKIIEADDAKLTATGTGLGTPAYMAPEQAQGSLNVGEMADLYAVGVVLYEMLTARLPFHADTPLAVLQRVIYDPVPPPREFTADIPDALQGVVLKTLAKDPGARYPSMAAFVEAAKESLVGVSTGVGPVVSPAHPLPPPPPSNTPVTDGGTVIMTGDDAVSGDPAGAADGGKGSVPPPISATTQDVDAGEASPEQAVPAKGNRTLIVAAAVMVLLLVLLGAGAVAVGLWGWNQRSKEVAEGESLAAFAERSGGVGFTAPKESTPDSGSEDSAEAATGGGLEPTEMEAASTEAAPNQSSRAQSSAAQSSGAQAREPGSSSRGGASASSSPSVKGSTTAAGGNGASAKSSQEPTSENWRNRGRDTGQAPPADSAPAASGPRFLGEMRFGRSAYGEVEPEEPVSFELEVKRRTTFYFDVVSQTRRATYTLLDPDGLEVFREGGSDVGPITVEKKGIYSLVVETDGDIPIEFEINFARIGG